MSHYHPVLHNPFWASSEIHAQVMTHKGKNMVCLAFTLDQAQLLIDTIRESPYDYRMTITDGPARQFESRKDGRVTTAYQDGLWNRKTSASADTEMVLAGMEDE